MQQLRDERLLTPQQVEDGGGVVGIALQGLHDQLHGLLGDHERDFLGVLLFAH